MESEDLRELAASWHRFFEHIEDEGKRESDHWAAIKVHRLLHDSFVVKESDEGVIDDPERAWKVILFLIEAAPSRKGLTAIAFGPLRQLLDNYFDEFILRIGDEALRNNRLQYALSHVFIHNQKHLAQINSLGRRAAVLRFSDTHEKEQLEEVERQVRKWFVWIRESANNDFDFDCDLDPHQSWKIIQRLLEESKTNAELENIAEPISAVLSACYEDFIQLVMQALPTDERLGFVLGDVYVSEQSEHWQDFVALVDRYRKSAPFR